MQRQVFLNGVFTTLHVVLRMQETINTYLEMKMKSHLAEVVAVNINTQQSTEGVINDYKYDAQDTHTTCKKPPNLWP